jgi:large subunit ribosomal protein L3
MNGLIGKKIGMTSIFDDTGKMIAVTVIQIESNVVTQVKTIKSDKYEALQISAGKTKIKNVTKQLQGHYAKANTEPLKKSIELRKSTLDKKLGDKLNIEDVFNEGDKISAVGVTKGKGFQGVVRRHGFSGVGDATHGQHNRLRAPGSVGASSFPSKVVKGLRMAGRMGGTQVKIKNLKVVKILPEKDLLLLSGAVPGHKGSFIILEK